MKLRSLLWIAPFVIGLGLAYGGAQLRSSPADPDTRPLDGRAEIESGGDVGASGDRGSDESAARSPAIRSVDDDADAPGSSSPGLSTVPRPLSPAFPEIVLPALSEQVGSAPERVTIDEIGVELAPVQPVGIEPNGELEVPGATAVGWYEFGVGVDGGTGSAVLAAHIAFNGRDGVFRDLADVPIGAEVVVESADGPVTYRVTELAQYAKAELPIADLFREDGDERLVLITCGGSFNPSLRSYDDNVVAIAVPV